MFCLGVELSEVSVAAALSVQLVVVAAVVLVTGDVTAVVMAAALSVIGLVVIGLGLLAVETAGDLVFDSIGLAARLTTGVVGRSSVVSSG